MELGCAEVEESAARVCFLRARACLRCLALSLLLLRHPSQASRVEFCRTSCGAMLLFLAPVMAFVATLPALMAATLAFMAATLTFAGGLLTSSAAVPAGPSHVAR
eukprot:3480297-Rhodomonas_salina.2